LYLTSTVFENFQYNSIDVMSHILLATSLGSAEISFEGHLRSRTTTCFDKSYGHMLTQRGEVRHLLW